jgi:hypothetical protein
VLGGDDQRIALQPEPAAFLDAQVEAVSDPVRGYVRREDLEEALPGGAAAGNPGVKDMRFHTSLQGVQRTVRGGQMMEADFRKQSKGLWSLAADDASRDDFPWPPGPADVAGPGPP